MLRLLLFLLLALVMIPGCSSDDSDTDGGTDARTQDYGKIEGPTTNPIVDMPVHQPDLGAADAASE